jgi:hypothetical protein
MPPEAIDILTSRVTWARTHRLILSHFPPISLFDDIADPADWELLAEAESRTNPRIFEEVGNLALIPPDRRIFGPGASWVMASFTHVTPDRTSRFADGTFGAYYAGDTVETAVHEHAFHMANHYRSTADAPGWISQVRELIGSIDADLIDLRGRGFEALLNPNSYAASQDFARNQRTAGANGIVYPSVRHRSGHCIAALWPDVVTPPMQGAHYSYHWNGDTIDYVRLISSDEQVFALTFED